MSDILGGPALSFNCKLAANGLAMNMTVLLDTGAGGEAFIHLKYFDFIEKKLGLYIRTAQRAVPLAGYNNRNSETISRAFTASLVIDQRRIATHFLFCNTGRHDVILGRKWFEKTKTLVDCFGRKLIWPKEAQYQAVRDLIVARSELKPQEVKPEHQADAERRDQLHAAATPTRILRRSQSLPNATPPHQRESRSWSSEPNQRHGRPSNRPTRTK